MAHEVFIIHLGWDAREAKEIFSEQAKEIRSELERSGIRCWSWSRDFVEGLDFERQIEEAIEAANVVIAIWSYGAMEHPSSHVLIKPS
jgi:hypothetical protein